MASYFSALATPALQSAKYGDEWRQMFARDHFYLGEFDPREIRVEFYADEGGGHPVVKQEVTLKNAWWDPL